MINNTKTIQNGYKETELGIFPQDWKSVKLGEILQEVDLRYKRIQSSSEIPVLSITRYDGLVLQSEKFKKRVAGRNIDNYKVVKKNQIVYGFPMDEGVIYALRNFDIGIVSPVYNVWEVIFDDIDIEYLDQFLRTPLMISTYKRYLSSTVERRRIVSKKDFKNISIPLPPLSEQRAIAYVLRTVQEAKEKTEKVIEAARELKKSLMHHLFTYGPVPFHDADKVKLKETEVGMVPEEWEIVEIKEVVDIRREGVDPNKYDNLLYVGLEHIDSGEIELNRHDYSSKVRSQKSKFYPNDILYGKLRPYLDKAVLTKQEGICSTDILVFKTDHQVLVPKFFAYYLHTKQFINYANSTTTGVHHPRTSWAAIRKYYVPLPKLDIQLEVADILDSLDRIIRSEQNHLNMNDSLFQSFLHYLMTAKIRVNNINFPEQSAEVA